MKMNMDLDSYLPKVKAMQFDFEDLKFQVEDELKAAKQSSSLGVGADYGAQIQDLKNQIENGLKNNSNSSAPDQKNKNQFQEMFRKSQEHDRDIRKIKSLMETVVS